MVAEKGAAEAARELATALESAGLSYAIGGALALAVAGVPRGTLDVDVNLFVDEALLGDALDALASADVQVDTTTAKVCASRDGMFVGRLAGMRIDVFVPSIPFSYEAERTRVRLTDDTGWSGWFLSAEALSVFKLLFFRAKDVVDLERLVAVRPELDKAYIRRWIVDMMGEDDERTRRWDALCERFASG